MPARALPYALGTTSAAPDRPTTLPAYLAHWAQHTPIRPAFTFVDHASSGLRGSYRTLTWQRVDVRTRAVAARLADTVAPGERVAVLCPQGTEYVIGFLAALTAGAVAGTGPDGRPCLPRSACGSLATPVQSNRFDGT